MLKFYDYICRRYFSTYTSCCCVSVIRSEAMFPASFPVSILWFLCFILGPSEPYSLEIVSIASSFLTFQWMPPKVPNGVITQYSIQLNGTNISSLSRNELMYTIEGLSPDTVYVLQVRAHTVLGAGPSSSITVVTCKLLIITNTCQ